MLYYPAMIQVSSLYLHFPFCKHLCNYCDFYKHKLTDYSQILEFEQLLEQSWEVHENLLLQHNANLAELETLYLGGGTPSLWAKAGAIFFKENFIGKRLRLASNCEFTMEVDPGTWTQDTIDAWRDNGVNRFSLGVQAYDDRQLEILDRNHRVSDVKKTLEYFQKLKVNFSLDFIIGLPEYDGTKRDIRSELLNMMDYAPSHFSVYILQTRKNYPHLSKLPDDNIQSDQYLEVVELLEANGFNQYEISNFSKSGKESKHNYKYWNYESVAAIGANATGLIVNGEQATRYQWKSLSAGYQIEALDYESWRIEKVYLALRTKKGLDISFIVKSYQGKNSESVITSKIKKAMQRWRELGYLAKECYLESSSVISLNPRGLLMLDSIMDDLFKESVL